MKKLIADALVWIANRLRPGYQNLDDVIRRQIAIWDGDGPKIHTINDAPPEIASQYLNWQTARYSGDSYNVRPSANATAHVAGGPPLHRGAECHLCNRPLLNFWTFDGEGLQENLPALFKDRTKLSFYHCPWHGNTTCYRLVNDHEAIVFPGEYLHDESPFVELDESILPEKLTPAFLEVRTIPRDLANLIALTNSYATDYLQESEKTALRHFFNIEESDSRFDLSIYGQLGGVLKLWQGEEEYACPNPDCPLSQKIDRSVTVDQAIRWAYRMKQLALIPIVKHPDFPDCWHQLAVHVCWYCHTLHTSCVVT